MRVARAVLGVVLVLVSLPVVLASGALWVVGRHRDASGTFTAATEQIAAPGYALVVEDVDQLVSTDAAFIRGGHTVISVTASSAKPLFIGLAPTAAVRHYLAAVGYTAVSRVRPAIGALPVDLTDVEPVPGADGQPPAAPFEQPMWLGWSTGRTAASGVTDAVTWDSTASHGQRLALVIMNGDGSPGLDLRASATVDPQWLVPSMIGMLVFGVVVMLFGITVMAWPVRPRREVVYLVDQGDLADLAERLAAGRGSAAGVSPPGRGGIAPAGDQVVAVRRENAMAANVGPITVNGTGTGRNRLPRSSSNGVAVAARAGSAPNGVAVAAGAGSMSPNGAAAGVGTGSTSSNGRVAGGSTVSKNRATWSVTPNWIALLASTRPPATPRLMWPPKKAARTNAPVPVIEAFAAGERPVEAALVEAGSQHEYR